MTRHSLIGLVFGLLTVSPALAQPDESARLVKYYAWFLGEWTVSQPGDASTLGSLSVTEASSRRCQLVVFSFGNARGDALWGYDGAAARWTGAGFESDGVHWRNVVDKVSSDRIKPGDSWVSHATTMDVAGTKGSNTCTWTIVDPNTFVVKTTQRVAGSAKLPDIEFRYARKNAGGR